MNSESDNILLEILDEIERKESTLLGWGEVDGFFTYDELKDDIVEPALETSVYAELIGNWDSDSIIKELIEMKKEAEELRQDPTAITIS